jgi:hypothetical protein
MHADMHEYEDALLTGTQLGCWDGMNEWGVSLN